MKTFEDWLKNKLREGIYSGSPEGPKGMMYKMMSILSNFEPKEVEECKNELFELRKIIESKLTGGE